MSYAELLAAPEALRPDRLLEASEAGDDDEPDDPLGPQQRAALHRALDRIPIEDAQLLRAVVFGESSQRVYADYLGISQPAVSYRLRRALQRLRWCLPPEAGSLFLPEHVTHELAPYLGPRTLAILATLWETTSESETNRRLAVRTGPRRYQYLVATVESLARRHPGLSRFAQGFRALLGLGNQRGRLNILSRQGRHGPMAGTPRPVNRPMEHGVLI